MKRRIFFGLTLVLLMVSSGISAQPNPDFSGTWKLSGDRSLPKRSGNVTLRIDQDQHDSQLSVETTILRDAGVPRHAVQHYTTDGKVSVSTGADGDEFHASIVRDADRLIFSVEEHEDGRIILSTETWTLIEKGAALQRDRELLHPSATGAGKQKLIYLREAPRH